MVFGLLLFDKVGMEAGRGVTTKDVVVARRLLARGARLAHGADPGARVAGPKLWHGSVGANRAVHVGGRRVTHDRQGAGRPESGWGLLP